MSDQSESTIHALAGVGPNTIPNALAGGNGNITLVADIFTGGRWVTYKLNPSDVYDLMGLGNVPFVTTESASYLDNALVISAGSNISLNIANGRVEVSSITTWGQIGGSLSNQSDLSDALSQKVSTATTVNGYALSSNINLSSSDIGLGNVVNVPQTYSSIVPNTVPSSGDFLIGNSGGSYSPKQLSGDISVSQTGIVIVAKSNGTSFGSAAFTSSSAYDPAGAAAAITLSSLGGQAAGANMYLPLGGWLRFDGSGDGNWAIGLAVGGVSSFGLLGDGSRAIQVTTGGGGAGANYDGFSVGPVGGPAIIECRGVDGMFGIGGSVYLDTLPTSSVSTYKVLTLNTSTKIVEQVDPSTFGGGGGGGSWGSITGTLSNQTDLQEALNAKLNFPTPSQITFATPLTPSYNTGSKQDIIATSSFTLNAPSNPVDGAELLLRIFTDSGAWTLTLGSGFGSYSIPSLSGLSFPYTMEMNKWYYLKLEYLRSQWNIVSFVGGYIWD